MTAANCRNLIRARLAAICCLFILSIGLDGSLVFRWFSLIFSLPGKIFSRRTLLLYFFWLEGLCARTSGSGAMSIVHRFKIGYWVPGPIDSQVRLDPAVQGVPVKKNREQLKSQPKDVLTTQTLIYVLCYSALVHENVAYHKQKGKLINRSYWSLSYTLQKSQVSSRTV